ncbi:MAG: HEAT repeat domain-containing protein [Planctomycetota bacterium]|nr:HEAT repeat domain-containing protein [Planctomycetota bacterium]
MGLFDFLKKKQDAPTAGPDPELDALVRKLKDPDPKVRLDTCLKLGAMKARAASARPALEELIVDPDGDVCLAAAEAMSVILRAMDQRQR